MEDKTTVNRRDAAAREDCAVGEFSDKRSDMSAEINEPNLVEASTLPRLEVNDESLLQTPAVTVRSSDSSGSLESTDSITEFFEDPSSELSELKRVFQTVDEDQDNFICVADLCHFMGKLGFDISEKEATAMLETVDKDGDGKVALGEFCTLYEQSSNNDEPLLEAEGMASDEDDSIHQAFGVFDKNGDGVITAQELQVVLLRMGRPEGKSLENCERMIRGVDTDGNGRVDIQEFKHMMSLKFPH